MPRAILLEPLDNGLVLPKAAICDYVIEEAQLTALADIPAGHKIVRRTTAPQPEASRL